MILLLCLAGLVAYILASDDYVFRFDLKDVVYNSHGLFVRMRLFRFYPAHVGRAKALYFNGIWLPVMQRITVYDKAYKEITDKAVQDILQRDYVRLLPTSVQIESCNARRTNPSNKPNYIFATGAREPLNASAKDRRFTIVK
jgi:hypothetical protein